MRIEIKACRFAINELIARGSKGYLSWDKEINNSSMIDWDEVLKWLDGLEEFYETKI